MNPAHICCALSRAGVVACLMSVPTAIADDLVDREALTLRWNCTQMHDESFNVRCTPRLEGTSPRTFPLRMAARFWEDIIGPTQASPYAVATAGRASDTRPVAMRYTDEIFSGEAWYVPLHSRPAELSNVIRALQSALCGKVDRCRVIYGDGGN